MKRKGMSVFFLAGGLYLAACGAGDETRQYTEPSREERGHIHVLRLVGTPYEMGLQHGELMAPELAEGAEFIETDPTFSMFLPLARAMGLIDDALANSYPDVYDECRGMADATRGAGMEGLDLEACVALAYGDVILEFLTEGLGGCTQFSATAGATPDGTLVHARNMDWDRLQYLIDHPTLIVRRPEGKIPYVVVGYPGCVAPSTGMNVEGIAVASNENTALEDRDREGRSHLQMIRQIFQECSSLEEAEAFLAAQDHTTAESLMISDGNSGKAAVFEMTANHIGVRRLDEDGLVYMTNHFVHPEMADLHAPRGPETSTRSRFARLEELLPPDGEESLYGRLDVASAVSILRDTYNPYTGETNPVDLFDGGGSIANNGAIHSVVFLPEQRVFYAALGEPPVPQRTFIGFSMDELLEEDGAGPPDPPSYQ